MIAQPGKESISKFCIVNISEPKLQIILRVAGQDVSGTPIQWKSTTHASVHSESIVGHEVPPPRPRGGLIIRITLAGLNAMTVICVVCVECMHG